LIARKIDSLLLSFSLSLSLIAQSLAKAICIQIVAVKLNLSSVPMNIAGTEVNSRHRRTNL